MSKEIVESDLSAEGKLQLFVQGNLANLSPADKLKYYETFCLSLKLNPLTRPFEYLKMNNKEVLYANKACAEQLRMVNNITVSITKTETMQDIYIVYAHAVIPGQPNRPCREDDSTGAVSLTGLKGDQLANAIMKAETKAKRRVTLSICGLGILDESEIETIPNARRMPVPEPPAQKRQLGREEEKLIEQKVAAIPPPTKFVNPFEEDE